MNHSPRIPNGEKEVFAMAFMIGYIGWIPDDLASTFPDETFETAPSWIHPELVGVWQRGYDVGSAFFCDHSLDDEEV